MQWAIPSFKICQITVYAISEDMRVEMETDSYTWPHVSFYQCVPEHIREEVSP